MWSRALSSEEISNAIDIQLPGNENGLEYYFRTDGDGDVIANYSMNNNYYATIINYNASSRNNSYLDWMIYSCESSKWNISDISTGIKEGTPDYCLRVAPNPSHGNFYYSFSLPSQDNVIINIFDMEGKLLFQRKYYNITSVKDFVNMSFPSKGTYILSLQQNENKQTKMFVIQ